MDIKGNEIDRPKHLPDVFKITEKRVGDPPLQRQELSRTKRKVLGPQSRKTRTNRWGKEGNLSKTQPAPRQRVLTAALWPLPARRSLGEGGTSVERPIIEQEQDDWHRNQHRFRHQTAREQDRRHQVAANRLFS